MRWVLCRACGEQAEPSPGFPAWPAALPALGSSRKPVCAAPKQPGCLTEALDILEGGSSVEDECRGEGSDLRWSAGLCDLWVLTVQFDQ